MTRTTTERLEAEQLEAELHAYLGSDERIGHSTRRFLYTLGVQHLAERAGVYWLLHLIAAHCRDPRLAGSEWQIWVLKVHPNRSAALSVEDANEAAKNRKVAELLSCTIDSTDFPLAEVELYLIDGVLMLPSEY